MFHPQRWVVSLGKVLHRPHTLTPALGKSLPAYPQGVPHLQGGEVQNQLWVNLPSLVLKIVCLKNITMFSSTNEFLPHKLRSIDA